MVPSNAVFILPWAFIYTEDIVSTADDVRVFTVFKFVGSGS